MQLYSLAKVAAIAVAGSVVFEAGVYCVHVGSGLPWHPSTLTRFRFVSSTHVDACVSIVASRQWSVALLPRIYMCPSITGDFFMHAVGGNLNIVCPSPLLSSAPTSPAPFPASGPHSCLIDDKPLDADVLMYNNNNNIIPYVSSG